MIPIIHRREKIVFRAIDVINESGVQALSTKKLAQLEKIAESTIFKHFKSKNDILSAVLDFYSQYDNDIEESIRVKGLVGLEAVKFYLDSYIKYYENYPEITSITQGLDEMRYEKALESKVIEVINRRTKCLKRIIEQAIEQKEISDEFTADSYADVIMGGINGIIRRWRMENQSFDLYSRSTDAISLILRSKSIFERGEESV